MFRPAFFRPMLLLACCMAGIFFASCLDKATNTDLGPGTDTLPTVDTIPKVDTVPKVDTTPAVVPIPSGWTRLNSGVSVSLKKVYFLNPSTGFAIGSGGVILKTTNGGDTWTKVLSGTTADLVDIQFVDSLTGYSTGGGAANLSGYSSNIFAILKTTDGGWTWFSQPFASPTFDGVNAQNWNFLGLHFLNRDTGFVGGDMILRGGRYEKSSGLLYKTLDGGSNWIAVDSAPPTASIRFASPTEGFAVYARTLGAGTGNGFVFTISRSSNGGLTWRSLPTTGLYSNTSALGGAQYLVGILDIQASSDKPFYAIAYTTYRDGYRLFVANLTPGDTVSATNFTNVAYEPLGASAAGNNTVLVVGAQGFVAKSTDRGATWAMLNGGNAVALRSVTFVDSVTAIAVGVGGIIIKTTTAGDP